MASGKTDTYENSIINHFLRGSSQTATSGYLALYSVAPGESSSGTELTGNGYARIAVGLGAPSAGVATNTGTITFTASGGAWSAIVGHSICNASSAGDILMYEDSVSGPTLSDGDSYEFDAADVTVTET
ncbi:MAG: hypothetical protein JAY90_18510 [Candidatus Thiodiazotropha lotti]|nr:hypothetical protein [Candidatus Thiodiazotropha lotti]